MSTNGLSTPPPRVATAGQPAATLPASGTLRVRGGSGWKVTRSPEVDFIYYSNDMIGAGGLLYCLDEQIDVPGRVGLAGFNGVELLDGLPRKLATMDACRLEIGKKAARLIADAPVEAQVEELFGVPRRLLRDGEGWAVERITLSTHNGTHMDAPWHFHSTTDSGASPAPSIDEAPLDRFFRQM